MTGRLRLLVREVRKDTGDPAFLFLQVPSEPERLKVPILLPPTHQGDG